MILVVLTGEPFVRVATLLGPAAGLSDTTDVLDNLQIAAAEGLHTIHLNEKREPI
jgi:hypothetical protein